MRYKTYNIMETGRSQAIPAQCTIYANGFPRSVITRLFHLHSESLVARNSDLKVSTLRGGRINVRLIPRNLITIQYFRYTLTQQRTNAYGPPASVSYKCQRSLSFASNASNEPRSLAFEPNVTDRTFLDNRELELSKRVRHRQGDS